MACATCEKHGDTAYCTVCDWRGYESTAGRYELVKTAGPDEVYLICPKCHDQLDLAALPLGELTQVYLDECPDCPGGHDVHVTLLSRASLCDPEDHDLRGLGCPCNPEAVGDISTRRVIIHKPLVL